MADTPTPKVLFTVCRECREGKHPNCDGHSWDPDADLPTDCACSVRVHQDPCTHAWLSDDTARTLMRLNRLKPADVFAMTEEQQAEFVTAARAAEAQVHQCILATGHDGTTHRDATGHEWDTRTADEDDD